MTNKALILPWVELREPLVIGDVTFLPLDDAVRAAGGNAAALQNYGSIYVDGYTLALAMERGEKAPRLRPAVAVVADTDAYARHVRDAVDVLMVSTILENGVLSANATTFAYVVRSIDGDPNFMVDFTSRMSGSTTNGISPETYFEMRPPRTGTFHYGRKSAMVAALLAALSGPFAPELRVIIDTLRTAMSESADVSLDLAESLLAKAATLLTFVPGIPDKKREMLARLRTMLAGVIPDSTSDKYGTHIARVWQAVRDHRNEFWHPVTFPSATFPFMEQTLVSPVLLAMRMIHALLAARLIELGCAPSDGDLTDDVVAIDAWIGTLEPALEAGLLPVTNPTTMMARRDRVQAAHDAFGKLRSHAHFQRGVKSFLKTNP